MADDHKINPSTANLDAVRSDDDLDLLYLRLDTTNDPLTGDLDMAANTISCSQFKVTAAGGAMTWDNFKDGATAITRVTNTGTGGCDLNVDNTIRCENADVNNSLRAGDIIIDEDTGVLDFVSTTSATISASGVGRITIPDIVDMDSGSGDSPVLNLIDGDNFILQFKKDDDGFSTMINSEGAMLFAMSGDTNDFIVMSTLLNTPGLSTSGGGNLSIDSSSGTVQHIANINTFAQYLAHDDDLNTYMQFVDDRVIFVVGGEALLDMTESTQDVVKIGDGGDVDINLAGGADKALFVEGSSGKTYIGDGGTTDFLEIERDGTIKFNGAATVWRDINIGAATLSGPPGLQPGIVNFLDEVGGDTGIATYGLAVGEGFSGQFEMQHDYKEGSDITFHLHWQGITAPTGTDKVKFQLTYTMAQMETTLNATTVITIETDFDTQYEFKISSFAAITGTNFNIGDQFLFTLQRIAASADEYGGEALIATVGIHYEIDTVGSRGITTK